MAVNQQAPYAEEPRDAVKDRVQAFYDEIGWREVSQGIYQNASYEDLRPVAREYIHRCHLRVMRHLMPKGTYLLDAGSGPIQYPEYLEYSRGYRFRVCADISSVALKEARKRIGDHGLFVVADVANLPFKPGVFEGVVSLHTIHHLPESEHSQAYQEISPGVGPWGEWSRCEWMESLAIDAPVRACGAAVKIPGSTSCRAACPGGRSKPEPPQGTFVNKNNASWLKQEIGRSVPLKIYCWRSVSVGFMRALIHPRLGGRWWLRLIFWLEDLSPQFFGEKGQYPLVVVYKQDRTRSKE
jgi:hypothetical protein